MLKCIKKLKKDGIFIEVVCKLCLFLLLVLVIIIGLLLTQSKTANAPNDENKIQVEVNDTVEK